MVAEIKEACGVDAHHKTIVKILKKQNILSIMAAKRPSLTATQAANRLRFVRSKENFAFDDWKTWTFSDESMIELDCAEGVQRFLITPQQRYMPEFVIGKKQQGGGKVMIWSYISYDGLGPLIFIEGGIDAKVYIDILKTYVLPHCLTCLAENGAVQTYMDDGASSHDSELVIDFCSRKGIQRPYWPSSSPDLNPIEHVWGWIKHKLTRLKAKPKNLTELKSILVRFWEEIKLESIQKLFVGMPKRIKAVKDANGWNTNK